MTTDIQSFRIAVPDRDLDDLHVRLKNARWPSPLPGDEWSRGIPIGFVQDLARYWRDEFDWRAIETRLNELPHYQTTIDGQTIHFVHVRSAHRDAIPLLITHGYPSSFAEFTDLIEFLVAPENGAQSFHVVAPSLPGYGFSTPVSESGWAMGRTARAWVELMHRLGYARYGVHGADVGAGVSGSVAALDGDRVVGLHVVTDPAGAAATATFMPGMADSLDPTDDVDELILERMQRFRDEDSGYLAIQNSRPLTVGYGLVDSPIAQLAWIADSFERWRDLPISWDALLTNVSIYWFTGTAMSAAGLLYEQAHSSDWGGQPSVSEAYAVFGADATVRKLLNPSPESHWTEFERGGHFPALEAPELLARDIAEFFGGLRI